jgi:Kef-type K+ transport system membrane component KefB
MNSVKEIIFLTIFFTALALYLDIHGQHHVVSCVIHHMIALFIAIVLAKIISTIYARCK